MCWALGICAATYTECMEALRTKGEGGDALGRATGGE